MALDVCIAIIQIKGKKIWWQIMMNKKMKERNNEQVNLLAKNGDKWKVKLEKYCPRNYPLA